MQPHSPTLTARCAASQSLDDLLRAVAVDVTALADTVRENIARESSDRDALAPMPPRPVFLRYGTPGMR